MHGASRVPGLLVLGVLSAMAVAACSSSTSSGGGVDAGGAGSANDAGSCHGDAVAWASLTQGPIACTKNSDCCVIVNGCYSQTQVVAAANKDAAKTAWPTCDDKCNACIPPPTVVGCTNNVCTGYTVDIADAASDLMMDHCGVDGPAITTGALHFGC